MNTVISVKNLSKQFKTKIILSDMSFEVAAGDCLALIGPNGAGKTTLMNCLLGDLRTERGQVSVLGQAPDRAELKEKISVLFQENVTVNKLKVRELIDFQRNIYKNPLSLAQIDELLQFSQEQKEQLAEKLSGGQRRLFSFVLTLIGQPEILFLDEPTAGMDTSTRKRFWEIIDQLKAMGKTIIYSSHYIEEVEHTADRILVLHKGRLLKDTTPYAIRREDREKVFTLPLKYCSAISHLPIYDLEEKPDKISFATREAEVVFEGLQELGIAVADLEMTNRSLLDSLFDEGGMTNENL